MRTTPSCSGSSDDGEVVQVVGAGPAGLAAAITLARAGRKVLVHESQRGFGAGDVVEILVARQPTLPLPGRSARAVRGLMRWEAGSWDVNARGPSPPAG